MTEPLIGSREACQILGGINGATLGRWVDQGRIQQAFKAPGKNGARFFSREEVDRVAAELEQEQVPEAQPA